MFYKSSINQYIKFFFLVLTSFFGGSWDAIQAIPPDSPLGRYIHHALLHSPHFRQKILRRSTGEIEKRRSLLKYLPEAELTLEQAGDFILKLNQKLARGGTLSHITRDGKSDSRELILSWKPLESDRLDLEQARLKEAGTLTEFLQEREKFKFDLIRAYFEMASIESEVAVERLSMERLQKNLEYSDYRFKLGLANKIDMLNAKVRVDSAQKSILQLENRLEHSRDAFRAKVGLPFEEVIQLDLAALATAPLKLQGGEVREDLEGMKISAELQKIRWRMAERVTPLNPEVKLRRVLSPGQEETSGSVGFGWTFARRQDEGLESDIARQDFEQKQLAVMDFETQVAAEKRAALRRGELLARSLELTMAEVEAANESFEFSTESYQQGIISHISLLDSQEKLTRARKELASLELSRQLWVFEFYFAFGQDL